MLFKYILELTLIVEDVGTVKCCKICKQFTDRNKTVEATSILQNHILCVRKVENCKDALAFFEHYYASRNM